MIYNESKMLIVFKG